MESSIAVFLLRQPACERLPTIARRQLTERCRRQTITANKRKTPHIMARHACVQAPIHPTRRRARVQAANNTRPNHIASDNHRT